MQWQKKEHGIQAIRCIGGFKPTNTAEDEQDVQAWFPREEKGVWYTWRGDTEDVAAEGMAAV